MNVYFLTGASGAVGSAIVPLLLSEPTTRIRILIRATTEQHLRERFDERGVDPGEAVAVM